MFHKQTVTATTDASGDATVYTGKIRGIIHTIIYTKDGYSDGVDFTITTEDTAQTLWDEDNVNATAIRAPRQPTHAGDGSASLYAAAGEPVEDYIVAAEERVKIVVANGGNTVSGDFTVIYNDGF